MKTKEIEDKPQLGEGFSLKIGPSTWFVQFCHVAGATAETDYWTGTIKIDNEVPPSRWFPLLMHEILEVLNLQYGEALQLNHEQISLLGEALAQVFADGAEILTALAAMDGVPVDGSRESGEAEG